MLRVLVSDKPRYRAAIAAKNPPPPLERLPGPLSPTLLMLKKKLLAFLEFSV